MYSNVVLFSEVMRVAYRLARVRARELVNILANNFGCCCCHSDTRCVIQSKAWLSRSDVLRVWKKIRNHLYKFLGELYGIWKRL